jgi:hypothetical protein
MAASTSCAWSSEVKAKEEWRARAARERWISRRAATRWRRPGRPSSPQREHGPLPARGRCRRRPPLAAASAGSWLLLVILGVSRRNLLRVDRGCCHSPRYPQLLEHRRPRPVGGRSRRARPPRPAPPPSTEGVGASTRRGGDRRECVVTMISTRLPRRVRTAFSTPLAAPPRTPAMETAFPPTLPRACHRSSPPGRTPASRRLRAQSPCRRQGAPVVSAPVGARLSPDDAWGGNRSCTANGARMRHRWSD